MRYYDKEIIQGFNYIKKQAIKDCNKNRIDESLSKIKQLHLVGNRLTWKYDDADLNNLIDDLSFKILGKQVKGNGVDSNNVVFYDQYGKAFILALQYLEALAEAGFNILYILSDFVSAKPSDFIVDELKQYPNIRTVVIPSEWTVQKRAEEILRLTVSFAPARLFLHVKFFSVFNLVLPALPKDIVNYYIDLQDHAMWIKNHQIDYVIPYRIFGATVDLEKRGFNENQILLIPYYPITRNIPFNGFPMGLEDKVIIFTGGELYKTISTKNFYWRLVYGILNENPNAIVLYAIKGDCDNELLKKYKNSQESIRSRLIPIGFRNDIDEVFKHCDIYLGTSPMSGGLMSQYAAYYSKPILQFYPKDLSSNNETEQVLNYNGSGAISFTDERKFLDEAKRLINDASYRKMRGETIKSYLITREQFSSLLIKTIQDNKSHCFLERQKIDYRALSNWWFSLEKAGVSHCRDYLLSILKKKRYFVMPLSSLLFFLNSLFYYKLQNKAI